MKKLILVLIFISGLALGQDKPRVFVQGKGSQDVTTSAAAPQGAIADKDLSNITLDLTTNNKGIIVSLNKEPELDARAVRVNFESISGDASRADVMRVVLQSLSKLAPYHPTLVEFASSGQERLLLDGKDIPDVAFQYDHDKALPAWRMFAERAAKPDGTKMKLPEGLMAQTTASFALVDELIGSSKGGKTSVIVPGSSANSDDGLRKADPWHPSDSDEHGEVVSHMLQTTRARTLSVKDSRLDYQEVNQTMNSVNEAVLKVLTDAKIALQQQEQGGKAVVPAGSSELLGLQLKFKDIFALTDENLLVPVTPALAYSAPESTFAGLTVYGKHREVKTRITGKRKVWHSGVTTYSSGQSYYDTLLETDGKLMRPLMNEVLLRWGEIKDKIAFDVSDKKLEEDSNMERQALSAAN
ncbi:MAG: hypothetical protein WA172_22835 [Terriglobales bacterium]